ncbi:TPA: carbon storage regulator [Pseudomonas aeruginosa]|nr:carbon storage regulator [Pseudomonas aeruginosa]EKV3075356.1 carbon storage regulator [Pseudomonas aeruginosa]HBP5129006.1 carbon storage regulator [Pseudomonas aeruginosa]HCI1762982.1 carbon storage regulator [Pseudomonas aeruginosa]HCI2310318.1 carbon storage regulator [Pseudomonas aeruginosa]
MGFLVLTRTVGQRIVISARPGVDDAELGRQLRTEGVDVVVLGVAGRQVKVGVGAPAQVAIVRSELVMDS